MLRLIGILLFLGVRVSSFSSIYHKANSAIWSVKTQRLKMMVDPAKIDPAFFEGITEPEYKKFLSEQDNKPWSGSRMGLVRKGQVPLPEYSAREVVRICLAALQNNDDPQLDHGACVALEFKSPTGALAEGMLDPSGYGRFLRDTEYSSLIDFKSAELVGELEQLSDSISVRQQVKITDFQYGTATKGVNNFDFYLTLSAGCWLLDVILLRK